MQPAQRGEQPLPLRDVLHRRDPRDESVHGLCVMDAAQHHQRAVAERCGGFRIVEEGKARIARAELAEHLHRRVSDDRVAVAEQRGDGGCVFAELLCFDLLRLRRAAVGPHAGESVKSPHCYDGFVSHLRILVSQCRDAHLSLNGFRLPSCQFTSHTNKERSQLFFPP